MPGNHADIEQRIQDAAGALHPYARFTLAARPIPGLPGWRQAVWCNSAHRLLKTALSMLLTILRGPRPIRMLDERAGPTGHSRPALFPVTVPTCPVGLIDDTPACEHTRQERRRGLEADAE
jgi:hypothetical protein